MKQFLKYTLATITGIILVSLIGFLLLFGLIGALASKSDSVVKPQDNSVYEINLDGNLTERSQDDPFSGAFSGAFGSQINEIGLDDLLANIKKAKDNDNIKGIYLSGGSLGGGFASFKEVRDALIDFKESGKFIIAYADSYSQRSYYLVSVADKIYLNTKGMLAFQGMASNITFFKNTLDKLGVDMQIVKVGTYKSAVEPYIQTEMSAANREQVTVFTNTLWNNMLSEISASRNITVEKLNAYADEMLTFQNTEKILDYKMVDSLCYVDGMEDVLKNAVDVSEFKKVKMISHKQMNKVSSSEKMQKDKVAILYAVGGIDAGSNPLASGGIDSEKLVGSINKLKKDKAVKAVVLRVNSPGGSAYGSEQIWYAITQLQKEKPVIVSMGDYAASGGYYIACSADTIIAQPGTLTGSIGIFGTIPNTAGLNKKIGLTFDGVKTNKMSDAISTNRPFTPEERDLMQAYVNEGYELFVKRCAEGRNMDIDELKAIAEGRVWTGETALELGLVDMLGGVNDAVRVAAEKAGLENYMVKTYPEKEDFMTRLMKDLNTGIETRFLKSRLGDETYKVLQHIEELKEMNGIQALMPYHITFN